MVVTRDDEKGVEYICRNLRSQDRIEMEALLRLGPPALYPFAGEAFRFAAYKRLFRTKTRRPAAFFMAQPICSTALQVSMLATDDWPEVAAAFVRYGLRDFRPNALGAGYKRAECRVYAANGKAVRLLQRLGFAIEVRLSGYGVAGEEFLQMAWTLESYRDVHVLFPKSEYPEAAASANA